MTQQTNRRRHKWNWWAVPQIVFGVLLILFADDLFMKFIGIGVFVTALYWLRYPYSRS